MRIKSISKNHFLLFAFVSLLNLNGIGQNTKEILISLNKTYQDKSYQLDYSVLSIGGVDNSIKYSGSIAKDGLNLYLNTPEGVTIVNNKHHAYVDKMEKTIYLNDISKDRKESQQPFDVLSILDSILDQSNIKLVTHKNKFFMIEVNLNDNVTYEKVTLKINSNYQLVECTYYLKGNLYPFDKIRISYSNIKIGEKIKEKVFSTQSIIKIRKNKIIATSSYSGYEIKDMRKLNTL